MNFQEHNLNSSNFLKFEEIRTDQFVVYSVFEKNYNLLSFPELKTFINTGTLRISNPNHTSCQSYLQIYHLDHKNLEKEGVVSVAIGSIQASS